MILVFPVSAKDSHLALPLAKWMRKLGPYPRHTALIVWSQELPVEQREPIAVEFRAMGWAQPPRAFQAIIPVQNWPEAPNAIFEQTANMIEADPALQRPWYFFEADNVPLRKGWMDAMADEYNEDLSKPFLGYIDTTWELGQIGDRIAVGRHLSGTAIYPPSLISHTLAFVKPAQAFDLAMAGDIIRSARHTTKIHNNWNSQNYRWEERDGKRVLMSDVVQLRAQQFGDAINRPVSPEAWIVHGCKDLSLLRLVEAEHEQPVSLPPPPPAAPVPEPKAEEPAPLTKEEWDRIYAEQPLEKPRRMMSAETRRKMSEAAKARRAKRSMDNQELLR